MPLSKLRPATNQGGTTSATARHCGRNIRQADPPFEHLFAAKNIILPACHQSAPNSPELMRSTLGIMISQRCRLMSMLPDLILRHIAEMERHIADGQLRIQQHRDFIARLGEAGSDSTNAELLLDSLIGVQATHERLLKYLRSLLSRRVLEQPYFFSPRLSCFQHVLKLSSAASYCDHIQALRWWISGAGSCWPNASSGYPISGTTQNMIGDTEHPVSEHAPKTPANGTAGSFMKNFRELF